MWGATRLSAWIIYRITISIHAPRVGSDQIGSAVGRWRNISIHAPRVGSDGTGSGRGFRVLISIHAPRVGSDFGCAWVKGVAAYFNPRSPCGERPPRHRDDLPQQDFNPRSPCGERQHSFRPQVLTLGFQSTLPVWGATDFYNPMFANLGISIHAPRVGSDRISQRIQAGRGISIHAPRVGSDILAAQKRQEDWNFNPRSPCGERLSTPVNTPGTIRFQSTLPVWGATICVMVLFVSAVNFNPRSPCGERLSIFTVSPDSLRFQSTLPVWGATNRHQPKRPDSSISIHAPRVGSDVPSRLCVPVLPYFNPRSPCGERPLFVQSV